MHASCEWEVSALKWEEGERKDIWLTLAKTTKKQQSGGCGRVGGVTWVWDVDMKTQHSMMLI